MTDQMLEIAETFYMIFLITGGFAILAGGVLNRRGFSATLKGIPLWLGFVSLFWAALFLKAGLATFMAFVLYIMFTAAVKYAMWLIQAPKGKSRVNIALFVLKSAEILFRYAVYGLLFFTIASANLGIRNNWELSERAGNQLNNMVCSLLVLMGALYDEKNIDLVWEEFTKGAMRSYNFDN